MRGFVVGLIETAPKGSVTLHILRVDAGSGRW